MYSVIKRDGEVVEFDISKICEAIQKVFESIETIVEEVVENITNALGAFAHTLAHMFLHAFHHVAGAFRRVLTYNPAAMLQMAAIIRIKIKLLTASYLEHANVSRNEQLLRIQDRGSSEDPDSEIFSSISTIIDKSLSLEVSYVTFRSLSCGFYGRNYAAVYLVR